MLSFSAELGEWVTIPTTYAGGAQGKSGDDPTAQISIGPLEIDLSDLALVERLSGGRVDLTYGRQVVLYHGEMNVNHLSSSLDIFGGTLVNFEDLVARSKVAK